MGLKHNFTNFLKLATVRKSFVHDTDLINIYRSSTNYAGDGCEIGLFEATIPEFDCPV